MADSLRGNVVITRAEADSAELADALEAKNFHVMCAPFLKIHLHDDIVTPDLSSYAGVIFTSRNAVRAVQDKADFSGTFIFCVGDKTKAAAAHLGAKEVHSAGGNFQDLVSLLGEYNADKSLLYVRGEHVSHDLKALMPNVQAEELIVYHADIVNEIDPLVRQVLMRGEAGIVTFFSKRTAQAFVDWVKADPQSDSIAAALKRSKALCLGEPMVECLSALTWKDIQVAQAPNMMSFLNLFDDVQ